MAWSSRAKDDREAFDAAYQGWKDARSELDAWVHGVLESNTPVDPVEGQRLAERYKNALEAFMRVAKMFK